MELYEEVKVGSIYLKKNENALSLQCNKSKNCLQEVALDSEGQKVKYCILGETACKKKHNHSQKNCQNAV